jgi:DNA-directed RNA polymerase subunit E'/Rpb7
MFVVSILEDLVRINPANFSTPYTLAIQDELNKKYAIK